MSALTLMMKAMTVIKVNKIDKESIGYQGFILGLIAGLATFVLLVVYAGTAEDISQRNREDQLSGLAQVIPASYYQNDLLASQFAYLIDDKNYQVFIGKNDDKEISSYAVQFKTQGFSGDITILMGLDANFTILGVRVLEHTETPGLGDKIELARNNWILSFDGLSLTNRPTSSWAVAKDGGEFDQFTGATITPRAIVNEVHKTLQIMQSDIAEVIVKLIDEESQSE